MHGIWNQHYRRAETKSAWYESAGRYREAVGVFLTAGAKLFAHEEWAAEAAYKVLDARECRLSR